MDIAPSNNTTGYTRVLGDLRNQLVDLQRQLGTGQLSETYGGLGSGRDVAFSVNERLSRIDAYEQSIQLVDLRLDIVDLSVSRASEIVGEMRTAAFTDQFALEGTDQTSKQRQSRAYMDEVIALMNSQADGRYVFSGRNVFDRPVVETDVLLDGQGNQAGLKQLISERKAADAGILDNGRLATTTNLTQLTLAEDGVHPFGFKVTGATTDITDGAIVGPAGAPPEITLTLGPGLPVADETITYTLTLPDNTTRTVTLTATEDDPPGANQFTIGADVATTITNMDTALSESLESLAVTDLSVVSTSIAADDFFAGTTDTPPRRIAGPNFAGATGFAAGTTADTVVWYQGDNSMGNTRESAVATVDDGLQVAYGVRADEQAFSWLIQNLAVYASETFDANSEDDVARFKNLQTMVGDNLAYPTGTQTVDQVRAEVGIQRQTMAKAGDRHVADRAALLNLRDSVQAADVNEVAAQVLTLQTRLEASYQATSRIAQLSLVNFI